MTKQDVRDEIENIRRDIKTGDVIDPRYWEGFRDGLTASLRLINQ